MLGFLENPFRVFRRFFGRLRGPLRRIAAGQSPDSRRVERSRDADFVLSVFQLVTDAAELRLKLLQQVVRFLQPFRTFITRLGFFPLAGRLLDRLLPFTTGLRQCAFRGL